MPDRQVKVQETTPVGRHPVNVYRAERVIPEEANR